MFCKPPWYGYLHLSYAGKMTLYTIDLYYPLIDTIIIGWLLKVAKVKNSEKKIQISFGRILINKIVLCKSSAK